MKDKSLEYYFNWSCNALLGGNPVGSDQYLKDNMEMIHSTAQKLLTIINYEPVEIYRGIILTEEINELKPHDNFTYLSFSEDENIARSFADTSPQGFGSLFYLGDHGYVVKYTPKITEIIFHHKFVDLLPYEKAFRKAGFKEPLFRTQKEVTILQPSKSFTQIEKYESRSMV